MICDRCGQAIPIEKVRIKFSGMYDMHLFTTFEGDTLEEVVQAWREHNASPNMALVGGRGDKPIDLGPAMLCPATLTYEGNGKSFTRHVGKMVQPPGPYRSKEKAVKQLEEWIEAVSSDEDCMRALRLRGLPA